MAFVVTNHLADLMPGTTETDASLVEINPSARNWYVPVHLPDEAVRRHLLMVDPDDWSTRALPSEPDLHRPIAGIADPERRRGLVRVEHNGLAGE